MAIVKSCWNTCLPYNDVEEQEAKGMFVENITERNTLIIIHRREPLFIKHMLCKTLLFDY